MPFQGSTEETKPDGAGRHCKLKSSQLKINILRKKKVKAGVWSEFSHDKPENLAKFEAKLGIYKSSPQNIGSKARLSCSRRRFIPCLQKFSLHPLLAAGVGFSWKSPMDQLMRDEFLVGLVLRS